MGLRIGLTGFVLAMAVAAAAPAGSSPPAAPPGDSRALLSELNERWLGSYRTKDAATLRSVLAEDFVGIGTTGAKSDRETLVRRAVAPGFEVTAVRSEDVDIRVYGTTAIVTGRSILEGSRNGSPIGFTNRYTDVYLLRDGRWQAVAAHVSRVEP